MVSASEHYYSTCSTRRVKVPRCKNWFSPAPNPRNEVRRTTEECLSSLIRAARRDSVVRLAGILFLAISCFAQKDPGPRGAPAAAGGAVSGLSSDLMAVFQTGVAQFTQVEMVSDGLGPRFNSNSCSSCHAQPAVGGTSPGAG